MHRLIYASLLLTLLATATPWASAQDTTVPQVYFNPTMTQSPCSLDRVYFNFTVNEMINPSFTVADLITTGTLAAQASLQIALYSSSAAFESYIITATLNGAPTDGTLGVNFVGSVQDAAGNATTTTLKSNVITVRRQIPVNTLLPNADFELELGTAAGQPLYWSTTIPPGGQAPLSTQYSTFLSNAGGASSGSQFLRAVCNNPTGVLGTLRYTPADIFQLKPNRTYRWGLRYRASYPVSVALVYTRYGITAPVNTATGFTWLETFYIAPSEYPVYPPFPPGQWQEYVGTLNTPAPGLLQFDHAMSLIIRDAAPALNAIVDLDGAYLEEIGVNQAVVNAITNANTGTYDMGDGLQIILTHVTQGGGLRSTWVDAPPPGFPAAAVSIGHYWDVKDFTGVCSAEHLSFSYTDADLLAAGLQEDTLRIWTSEDGVHWTHPATTRDAAGNRVTTTDPVTDFSLWTLGGDGPESVPVAGANGKWALYE